MATFGEVSVSVDGFAAGDSATPDRPMGVNGERLLRWCYTGTVPSAHFESLSMHKSSQQVFDLLADRTGAIVIGRRTYDLLSAWDSDRPVGVPVVVVTSNPWDTNTVDPAVSTNDDLCGAVTAASRLAAEKDVAITGPSLIIQALESGMLDELHLHLVPILLGSGVRLFEGPLHNLPELELIGASAAADVTHLSYRILKSPAD